MICWMGWLDPGLLTAGKPSWGGPAATDIAGLVTAGKLSCGGPDAIDTVGMLQLVVGRRVGIEVTLGPVETVDVTLVTC